MKIEIYQEGVGSYRPSHTAMLLAFRVSQVACDGDRIEIRDFTKESPQQAFCVAVYGNRHEESREGIIAGLRGFDVILCLSRCDKEWETWSEIYVVPAEMETEATE